MDWIASLVQTLNAKTFNSNILLQLSTGPSETRNGEDCTLNRCLYIDMSAESQNYEATRDSRC
jgi:hypothetical protein